MVESHLSEKLNWNSDVTITVDTCDETPSQSNETNWLTWHDQQYLPILLSFRTEDNSTSMGVAALRRKPEQDVAIPYETVILLSKALRDGFVES